MWISAGILAALGLVPGFPVPPVHRAWRARTASVGMVLDARQGRAARRHDEPPSRTKRPSPRPAASGEPPARSSRSRSRSATPWCRWWTRPAAAICSSASAIMRKQVAHRARHRRAARPHPRQHPASGHRVRHQAPRHQGRGRRGDAASSPGAQYQPAAPSRSKASTRSIRASAFPPSGSRPTGGSRPRPTATASSRRRRCCRRI